LGVSRLIQAYKSSSVEVIKNAAIIEKQILFKYEIKFPFIQLNDVMKLLKQLDCQIQQQQFDADCEISFSIRKSQSELCEEKFKKITNLKLQHA